VIEQILNSDSISTAERHLATSDPQHEERLKERRRVPICTCMAGRSQVVRSFIFITSPSISGAFLRNYFIRQSLSYKQDRRHREKNPDSKIILTLQSKKNTLSTSSTSRLNSCSTSGKYLPSTISLLRNPSTGTRVSCFLNTNPFSSILLRVGRSRMSRMGTIWSEKTRLVVRWSGMCGGMFMNIWKGFSVE
jgi:hypothetical protein